MFNKKNYRSCIGITLFNKKGLVFIAERIDIAGAWQMPQGGIDKNENPKNAALRELEEEIGTKNVEILSFYDKWMYYDFPQNKSKRKIFHGKYKGQKQIWFAMKFLGKDKEIKIETKNPEFRRWKWVEFEKTIDLVVNFKKEIYKNVYKKFSNFGHNNSFNF